MENKYLIYSEYFEQNLKNKLVGLEVERVKSVRKLLISSTLYFISSIILVFAFVNININDIFRVLAFPLVIFLAYFLVLKSIINFIIEGRKFQNMLYEKVFPLFLQPVANFKSWPKNNNTVDIINSSLFGNFDTQEDVKSFFGFYNKTNIIISDTKLTMPVRGAIKQNFFRGTLIQLELEKSIDNHVVMFSKNEIKHNKFNQFNPKIDDMNKYMYVFAKNGNGLEFISENFWNELKRFGKLYTAKGFEFSYRNNIVLIAIRQKRPMIFGFLFKSLLNVKNYDELIKRFIVIYNIVDILNN